MTPPIRSTAAKPSEVVLEAVGLTRSFDGVLAVSGVTFALRRGRLTGLIGPNGAGKIDHAGDAGRHPAGQRRLTVTRARTSPRCRRTSGHVAGCVRTFQLASEFKRLTVLENLLSARCRASRATRSAGRCSAADTGGSRGAGDRPGRGACWTASA